MYVHTPILTGSDAEGAGEMFNVNCFDSSFKSAKQISGSIIQNSAACFTVLEFSALKVGPKEQKKSLKNLYLLQIIQLK